MTRESFKSSNVVSAGWERDESETGPVERGTLEVEFRGGRVYRYFRVPRSVWEGLRSVRDGGGSVGTYINAKVRLEYAWETA